MAVPIDPNILNALRARRPQAPTNPVSSPGAGTTNPLGGVLSNPGVVYAQDAANKAILDANNLLRTGRSQALIGFGSPSLAQSYGGGVDPNTASAAGANPYSTLAGLAHQNEIAKRNLMNSLAARGLTASGDTGYQQGEQARNYGQAQYGALQNLLASLNQQLGGYLGTTQTANDSVTQALLAAFQQFGNNPLGLNSG